MAEAVKIYTAEDEGKTIQRLFSANLDHLKKSAPRFLGSYAERLIRIAYSTIVFDEKLRKCTQASLMGGVLEALKLGLTLGGPAQEAWLIPFRDNRAGTMVATFIVGYQGMRNIIDRGRSVLDLHPSAVYQGDQFDFRRTEEGPKLNHVPYYMLDKPQGTLTHVYAVARLRGGGRQVEVLTKADVDKHRARSRAAQTGPWVTDPDAMALKTAIRVIAKYLPKSSELLSRALDLDQRADLGVDQEFDIEGIKVFDEPKSITEGAAASGMDVLKDRLAGKGDFVPAELKRDATVGDREPGAEG